MTNYLDLKHRIRNFKQPIRDRLNKKANKNTAIRTIR